MPRRNGLLLILLFAGCSPESTSEPRPDRAALAPVAAIPEETTAIPHNRGPDVEDGFRAGIHPLLAGGRALTLHADCAPIGTGRGYDEGYFPQQFRGPFEAFTVARPAAEWTAEDFSAFMPREVEQPGQTWELDVERVAPFLKQIHPGASMQLGAPGRLGGPNGGFALLRAVCDSHLDIIARVHAEFTLAPGVYLTPAYFEGRLLIDRVEGRVESFSLSLPTDIRLNTTLTVVLPTEALIDIVHVDRMTLTGGDLDAAAGLPWKREIPLADARTKLKGSFYRFLDIQWVPPDLAPAVAREQHRPILAVVLWGDLDDQSC